MVHSNKDIQIRLLWLNTSFLTRYISFISFITIILNFIFDNGRIYLLCFYLFSLIPTPVTIYYALERYPIWNAVVIENILSVVLHVYKLLVFQILLIFVLIIAVILLVYVSVLGDPTDNLSGLGYIVFTLLSQIILSFVNTIVLYKLYKVVKMYNVWLLKEPGNKDDYHRKNKLFYNFITERTKAKYLYLYLVYAIVIMALILINIDKIIIIDFTAHMSVNIYCLLVFYWCLISPIMPLLYLYHYSTYKHYYDKKQILKHVVNVHRNALIAMILTSIFFVYYTYIEKNISVKLHIIIFLFYGFLSNIWFYYYTKQKIQKIEN